MCCCHATCLERLFNWAPCSASGFVFPLPMLPGGLPPEQHRWFEAAVRALNWLSVGDLTLADGPATPTQQSLLEELQRSMGSLRQLGAQTFDGASIESYWRSKSVNGYGEEVHCALPFTWANVKHSLNESYPGLLMVLTLHLVESKTSLSAPWHI